MEYSLTQVIAQAVSTGMYPMAQPTFSYAALPPSFPGPPHGVPCHPSNGMVGFRGSDF